MKKYIILGVFCVMIAVLCTVFYKGHNKSGINAQILKEQEDKNNNSSNDIFCSETTLNPILETESGKIEPIKETMDMSNPDNGIVMIDGQYIIIGKDFVQKLKKIGFSLSGIHESKTLYQGQRARLNANKETGSISIISSANETEACVVQRSIITEISVNVKETNKLSVIFPGGVSIISPISKIIEIYGKGVLYENESVSELWYENDGYTLVVSFYTSTGEIIEMRYSHVLQ